MNGGGATDPNVSGLPRAGGGLLVSSKKSCRANFIHPVELCTPCTGVDYLGRPMASKGL